MQRLLLTAFVFLTTLGTTYGQIELTYSKSLSLTGVTAPRLAGDFVLVGADSKPSVTEVAIITAKSPSKFLRLKARKSLFEVGTLKQISDTEWVLSGAGEWIVEASSFDPERGIDEALLRIVIGGTPPKPEPGPGPQPDPNPDPEPGPKPEPNSDAKWIVVVEETNERSVETAKLMNNLKFWESLKTRGLQYRFYDDDSPDAASYRGYAVTTGFPSVLILDSKGTVLYMSKLPSGSKAEDEISRTVKEVSGR
jgi:hypothetical protein